MNHTAGIRTRSAVGSGPENKAAPAGNRGLTRATMKESTMAEVQSIRIPVRRGPQDDCADRSPLWGYLCNRPAGHTGRHLFAWRHVDGTVREVWS